MDLATLVNAPRHLEIGGRSFLVSALTMFEWGIFQGWIKDFVPRPDPPEGADKIDRALYRRAWPPAIGSRIWWECLDHPGCFPRFVGLVLSKHQVGMSEEEAIVLAMLAVEERAVGTLVLRAIGSEINPDDPPLKIEGEDADDGDERPESDEPGVLFHNFGKIYGWSHQDVISLSFPQVRYYAHSGRPPGRGERTFKSSSAARA